MMAKIAGVTSPLLNTGTKQIETNPFLGERSYQTTDTCIIESTLGKAALVQNGDDLMFTYDSSAQSQKMELKTNQSSLLYCRVLAWRTA